MSCFSTQAQQKKSFKFVGFRSDTCHLEEVFRKSFIDVPESNKTYWTMQKARQELLKSGDSEQVSKALKAMKTATVNIEFGNGFALLGNNEQAAKNAFRFAADIWETEVVSDVPITISANFQSFNSSSIIGSNSSSFFINTPNAPPGIIHTVALARAMAGFDFTPGTVDGTQTYNIDFDFYFGLDGKVPAGQIDFVTVVLHEIGHSMGISGLSNGGTGVGTPFQGDVVFTTWSKFIELGNGTPIIDLGFRSQEQTNALIGDDLFFDGPATRTVFNNQRPKIFAPERFQGGSSYSHWDESSFPTGSPNSLMTPRLARGEANRNIGDITRGALKDQGWVLNNEIAEPISVSGFTLINARTQDVIQPLTDGNTVYLGSITTGLASLVIRANTSPAEVGSVQMTLTGPTQFSTTENIAPYSLFGDNLSTGELYGRYLRPGQYSLTATPFSERGLNGNEGTPLSINFEIIDLSIGGLTLIDADTDEQILPIGESTLLFLDSLPQNINIQASTSPKTVGSVVFEIIRNRNQELLFRKVESFSPYALFGDDPRGDFNAGSLMPFLTQGSSLRIKATPYSEPGGKGIAGRTLNLGLNIIMGSPSITKLVLVNAATNQPIPGFDDLNEEVDIPLNIVGNNISVKAVVNDFTSSVRFRLDGPGGMMEKVEILLLMPYLLIKTEVLILGLLLLFWEAHLP